MWSADGPVPVEGVALFVLVQSKLSVLSWLHPHRPGSKLQLKDPGEAVVVGIVEAVLEGVGGAALDGFTKKENIHEIDSFFCGVSLNQDTLL